MWQAEPDGEDLLLTLHSPDGDQGFPGALDVQVRFRLYGNALVIEYTAHTDAPTVLNLTNHAYFNLAGAGTVMDHVLQQSRPTASSRLTWTCFRPGIYARWRARHSISATRRRSARGSTPTIHNSVSPAATTIALCWPMPRAPRRNRRPASAPAASAWSC